METTRYRALAARDPRFDGRFFVGVKTTGIYCRPICPARTPRPENVEFFVCAAGAESAGYRPCRRCRPETSPGTPAWQGTSTTVSRALRLIAEGALDDGDVDALAGRVGVGSRHLRRLFARHLGASPSAISRTRRLHFARQLIDETELRMGDVAFQAGFSSVRRFNAAIRSTFGRPPMDLRASRRRGPAAATPCGTLELRLPYRRPYDARGMLDYLAVRATPGVEEVDGNVYRRTLRQGECVGWVEVVVADEGTLRVRIADSLRPELLAVVERVRRVFDLAADPAAIQARLQRDPRLARALRRRPGLRVPGAWDPFELAVRAILGQQVSVRGATTLAGRLAQAWGEPADDLPAGSLVRQFPTPAALAAADIARIGMPPKRAQAIRELAALVSDGTLGLGWGDVPEEACRELVAIPGIGEWTASYVAMRGFGQPDAFPVGDLGVRKALAAADGRLPTAREVLQHAEAWSPWRAYAVLHLWMNPEKAT